MRVVLMGARCTSKWYLIWHIMEWNDTTIIVSLRTECSNEPSDLTDHDHSNHSQPKILDFGHTPALRLYPVLLHRAVLCFHSCTGTFKEATSDCTLFDTKGELAIQLGGGWKCLTDCGQLYRIQGFKSGNDNKTETRLSGIYASSPWFSHLKVCRLSSI